MKKFLFASLFLLTVWGWVDAVQAQRLDFKFYNDTAYVVRELYCSPHDATNWEEDILGSDVLPAGAASNIRFSPAEEADYWDIKVVLNGGYDYTFTAGYNLRRIYLVRFYFSGSQSHIEYTYRN